MNSIVIKTKLESLRKCLDRIEAKKPGTLGDLLQDIDIQDIIALNLERSVQLCVDIANHIFYRHSMMHRQCLWQRVLNDFPKRKLSQLNLLKTLKKQLGLEIYRFMPTIKSTGILFGIFLKEI